MSADGTQPPEPPIGTTLTAPQSRYQVTRRDDGWWVTTEDGTAVADLAPAGEWPRVALALAALGGPCTVTTEYQIAYRFSDPMIDGRADDDLADIHLADRFVSREHVTRWAATMQGTNAVEIIRVRSQRVTRSAWVDEPLEVQP